MQKYLLSYTKISLSKYRRALMEYLKVALYQVLINVRSVAFSAILFKLELMNYTNNVTYCLRSFTCFYRTMCK